MKPHRVAGIAALLVLGTLTACTNAGQPAGMAPTPTPHPVTAAPEGSRPRELLTPVGQIINWGEPTAAKLWPGPDAERANVQAAIAGAASELAAVDYTSLALPAFVTFTQAYTPQQQQFDGQDPEMDAYELAPDGGRGDLAIYSWKGPQLPDHPQRPQVHRWVQVYALYNMKQQRVLKLLATIGGEALE